MHARYCMRHAGVLRKPRATPRLSPTRWNPRAAHHCARQAGIRLARRCRGCGLAVSCVTGHPATTMRSSRRCGQWATVRKPVTVALQVVCVVAAGGSSHLPDPIRGTVLLPADSGLTAFVSAVVEVNRPCIPDHDDCDYWTWWPYWPSQTILPLICFAPRPHDKGHQLHPVIPTPWLTPSPAR